MSAMFVTRKVPVGSDKHDPSSRSGTVDVQAELFTAKGIRLMLHESVPSPFVGGPAWRCSDEATGFGLGAGETKEAAKADGVAKLLSNLDKHPIVVATLPIINPIAP